MAKKAYYNRVMSDKLENILKDKKYNWLIDFVKKHKELDFQTGSHEDKKGEIARSWFSIYRGTGRIITLQCGKRGILNIDAAEAYKKLDEDFYKKETWENNDVDDIRKRFESLLEKIDNNPKTFGRYYINEKKKEGYYQNLISRRYSLYCDPNDDLLIFDKEFVIGYESTKIKEKWGTGPKEWAEEKKEKIKTALGDSCAKEIKVPGDECDFVGINKNGDLVLLELKCDDPTKTYLAPLQVGMYDKLVTQLLKTYKKEVSDAILEMIKQKKALRILTPTWKELPKELSGNIKLAVVVGGGASEKVKRRFNIVRGVIEKEIEYYTCNNDGALEKIDIFKELEKKKHVKLIKSNFFEGDKGGGTWVKKIRCPRSKNKSGYELKTSTCSYILKDGDKNLHHSIREKAKSYFEVNKIKWWGDDDESKNGPHGHTLSSQIACLNHLFPIKNNYDAVKAIAKGINNDFCDVLPIPYDKEDDKGYIAFEVVSNNGYLNEKASTRGTNCTSVDAFIYAVDKAGKKWLVPIEWKYTETYKDEDKSTEDRPREAKGTNGKGIERMSRYDDLITKSELLKSLTKYQGSVYYQEPFYQLMRQTLWAEQVIKNNDIEADDYLHIHVVPQNNNDLLCKGFPSVDDTMETTWREMLTKEGNARYIIIDPKDLLAPITDSKTFPEYEDLIQYLNRRYWEM